MASIHLVLQCRHGVGKTLIAALLAQYLSDLDGPPLCIDADPGSAGLIGFPALAAQRRPLPADPAGQLAQGQALLDSAAAAPTAVVIDSGAGGFTALAQCLADGALAQRLDRQGQTLVVHSLVIGGPAFARSVDDLAQLAPRLPPPTLLVVWLNPFWGPLACAGRRFEQLPAFAALRPRIAALVPMPALAPATYGRDLSDMLQAGLTFDQALAQSSRQLLARQRLQTVRRRLFAALDNAQVL